MSMSFTDAVVECAMLPEFVDNYNRLTGSNFKLYTARNPIEALVDKACGFKGFDEDEVRKFMDFVYEYVWSRLPENCFEDEQQ